MIRKTIIVMLTLAAVGVGALWVLSTFGDLRWVVEHGPHPRVARLDFPDSTPRYLGPKTRLDVRGHALEVSRDGASESATRDAATFDGTISETSFRWHFAGFKVWQVSDSIMSYSFSFYRIPLWFPAAVFSTYPTLAFIRGPWRRYRRRRKGLCLECGYDLTGNVSGVCSECGTEIPKP